MNLPLPSALGLLEAEDYFNRYANLPPEVHEIGVAPPAQVSEGNAVVFVGEAEGAFYRSPPEDHQLVVRKPPVLASTPSDE